MSKDTWREPSNPDEVRLYLEKLTKIEIIGAYLWQWKERRRLEEELNEARTFLADQKELNNKLARKVDAMAAHIEIRDKAEED